MVSGENFSMSGVNFSITNVNVSMSGDNVSGQLLSKPVLTIPTECLSVKSLCSIINVLIEDLQSAKSRILELEHQQSSTEKKIVQIPEIKNLSNVGKLNELNKCYQQFPTVNTTKSHERTENDILHCRYCSQFHKRGKNHCPAKGNTCSKCQKLNHFASTCKTKILKRSYSSKSQNSASKMKLQDMRKSKSESDSKESRLISNLEKDSKNHREKDQPPQVSNSNSKWKKDVDYSENPKQPPMYPDGYLETRAKALKKLKSYYCEDHYKRSHRRGNGFIWCANHYRWNCNYCCWISNSSDPYDVTQTKREHDDVSRFKDVLINAKDQDERFPQQMRKCNYCSQMCQWKCKHCKNHYCSLYHISRDDSHEARCLKKQKAFRETTS